MQHDYNNHSRVNDFRSYIEYTEKSNCITRSFNQLFSRTALASHENICLNNHSKCAEWIIEHRNNQTKVLERV